MSRGSDKGVYVARRAFRLAKDIALLSVRGEKRDWVAAVAPSLVSTVRGEMGLGRMDMSREGVRSRLQVFVVRNEMEIWALCWALGICKAA
jgi:hypothetical protein